MTTRKLKRDVPIATSFGVNYTIVSYHRGGTKKALKSKWKINHNEELQCFEKAFGDDWIDEALGWGLHLT